ncbi:MAG: TIGR04348 family glycosyltransferase [Deltaproteobacteria bacterium]|nr:TIGR04348 family glycosyltransferase [Deltaproteobacteria bacterium]
MRIKLITPSLARVRNGNSITAVRWARILKQLGHQIFMEQSYDGGRCDLMIALHARRSFESIEHFRRLHPDLPLIVTLTGTDLYRDIRTNRNAQKSLDLAERLIVLQSMGVAELPKRLRAKTRVIYQSATAINGKVSGSRNGSFKVCVISHLRPEKDPLRTAMAARLLPASSRVRVLHIGRPLSKEMGTRLRAEAARNSRFQWLGELPHWKTRQVLANSHLLAVTSRMEGSSNVLCEAIASSVPVVASKIPGLIGTLGESYPGYFPVGDTGKLARLLQRLESDPKFYRRLKTYCARLLPLVDPNREVAAWKELLQELL